MPDSSGPNLICLSIDGLRAGMLGAYGNTWIRTPQLNRLAATSWLADQAFACEPVPSVALDRLWTDALLAHRATTLVTDDAAALDHLRAAAFGDRRFVIVPENTRPRRTIEETQLATFFVHAMEWLEQACEPFVLWLHTRGLAGAWDAPVALRNSYADEEDPTPPTFVQPPDQMLAGDVDPDLLLGISQAYAGQITLFDTCLCVLFDALDETPLGRSTDLLLVGLRGYPLGEHGRVGFSHASLHNELVHVPLLLRRANGANALVRTQSLVSHDDVAGLLANVPTGTPTRDRLIFQLGEERGIRTPAWYLRESGGAGNGRRELFVKPDDLWEANDIADRCQEVTTELAEVLASPERTEPLPTHLTKTHE